MNEFVGNDGIAINLNEGGSGFTVDGITLTQGQNSLTGNNGIDAPAIELATFEGNQLRVRLLDNGALTEGGSIELYLASPRTGDALLNGDSFGEGGTFIASVPVLDFVDGQWEITLDEPTFGFPDFMDGDSITAILIDNDSNTSEFGQNVEITVVTPVVLDALDSSITVDEDVEISFDTQDFVSTGADGSQFSGFDSIRIDSLPDSGTLRFQGNEVSLGDVMAGLVIPFADVDDLTFQGATNFNGSTSFLFSASSEGTIFGESALMVVDVDPVNDTPTNSAVTLTPTVDEGASRIITPVSYTHLTLPTKA